MPTVKHIENLDKKNHTQITQFGSKVGTTLKMLKENEPITNERIEQSPSRIDKLEGVINNLGSAFASVKTIPNFPSTKAAKFIYVPKNRGESSNGENEVLKMKCSPSFCQ